MSTFHLLIGLFLSMYEYDVLSLTNFSTCRPYTREDHIWPNFFRWYSRGQYRLWPHKRYWPHANDHYRPHAIGLRMRGEAQKVQLHMHRRKKTYIVLKEPYSNCCWYRRKFTRSNWRTNTWKTKMLKPIQSSTATDPDSVNQYDRQAGRIYFATSSNAYNHD